MVRSTLAKPVKIDGVSYDSLAKAEKILGISKGFLSLLRNKGRTEFKGMKLDFGKVKPKSNKFCGVYSPTLDKYFKTISKAAKYAKVDDWTMSRKMETAGEFIDSDNIKYIRLEPMNTKNMYKNTGPELQKIRKPRKKVIQSQVETCPVFIKDAISQYIKQLIKDSGVWDKICEAMDYCKIKEFKIKKD